MKPRPAAHTGRPLLLLLLLVYTHNSALAQKLNLTIVSPLTNVSTASPTTLPFRFSSHNNITILHEVRAHTGDGDSQPEPTPLVLNTHEILPQKAIKKKPHTLLDKILPLTTEYEKQKPLKEYDLHPVTFDFNLGDLEDLEHVTIKKGDLSAEEALPVLADIDDIDAIDSLPTDDLDGLDELAPLPANSSITTTPPPSPSPTTTTTTTSSGTSTATPTLPTVGPHILKIFKGKTSKKGRELAKKDELHKLSAGAVPNRISQYLSDGNVEDHDVNVTAEYLHSMNAFQLVTNLYDHFYWHAADIRTKVTTGCALEMQAYLTALQANYEWATKAYDASGRYRGQIFFGNDKWLGQKTFCYELNRELRPDERKHFEFEFFAAIVGVRLWMPHKIETNLQLGECLPKSCTAHDVHAILSLDPHAQMLMAALGSNENSTGGNESETSAFVQVRRVRKVPGNFNYWRELKFQFFISLMLSLVCIVIAGTWYQAKLNQRQLSPIPAVSATVDAHMDGSASTRTGCKASAAGYNGKSFELYQMKPLDNNNVVDIENDVNGNKDYIEKVHGCGKPVQRNGESGMTTEESKKTPCDSPLKEDCEAIETGSSAGAMAGPYEAKLQLGVHEQLLLCFAFQTNAATIFDITDKKESQTSCVHGLRVFSVMWTILVHTYLQMFTIGENRYQRVIVERSIWYQFVGNATFSVDTFFFISGFLVTLLYLKTAKKYPEDTGQFVRRSLVDTLIIVVYRYLRLTPAYLFVIFFNDFSLRQTFDSSVFQSNVVAADTCSRYWWRNILYINNFYPLSEICMIWSWYMANDMQFYIMASLLLVASTRYFKTAILAVCSFLISSWAVAGLVSLHYHYTHKVAKPFESFDFLYDKPWQRVGTYIMGMFAGYIMYKIKSPPKFARRYNSALLAGSIGLLALIIFGVWQGELSEIGTAFYVSMGHTAFGLALIWIVLSCCWDINPTLNRILSYRGLWPLSRLTYCTYLIHPVIMLITSYRMTGVVHLNNLFVFVIFLGNTVFSFGAAFFISILLEAPVIRILKICFRK